MDLKTNPGSVFGRCYVCSEEVMIPVHIEAVLTVDEHGSRPLMARVSSVDMQPMYDHFLDNHFDGPN